MNKYIITNLRNGNTFDVRGNSFPFHQSEWGKPAGVKLKSDCDAWEISNGTTGGLDPQGNELWNFPQSFSVVPTNIDAEIAAKAAKKVEKGNRRGRLTGETLTTVPAAFRGILRDIVDEIKELGGF
jgi:hypothetical protein